MNATKSNLSRELCFVLVFMAITTMSQSEILPSDSLKQVKPNPGAHIRSTARLHTKGMFNYGGRICSDNPAFDVNFIYDRKQWGFLFYKAFDLKDHTTANNFALAVFYKNFRLGNKITFTPHGGILLEQPQRFADHGSDFVFIATTAFKVNPRFTVEHTAMLANLLIEPDLRDCVNRLRLLYSSRHLDITYMLWNNSKIFDKNSYTSTGLTIAYSKIPLSDSFNLSAGMTGLSVIQSSHTESVPETNRIVLSLALQFIR